MGRDSVEPWVDEVTPQSGWLEGISPPPVLAEGQQIRWHESPREYPLGPVARVSDEPAESHPCRIRRCRRGLPQKSYQAMETKLRFLIPTVTAVFALFVSPGLLAAEAASGAPPASWHAQSFGEALLYMLVFAAVGIATAVVGYKVFDRCTPGDLHKEIVENKNVAAGIVAGSVILGVSIIIAAAMMG